MSDPGPSLSSPTILSALNSILTAHQSKPFSAPYLHPYAPSTISPSKNKGKGRAVDSESVQNQIDVLRRAIGALRGALTDPASAEKDGARLIRALKEVNIHQTALLPTLSSILPAPNTSSPPLLPSSRLLLHPTALLQNLATSIGLQAFLEDSQFGLLKTSLAIAGTRFVVDVDLEADPTPGEDGDVDEDEPMATSLPIPEGSAAGIRQAARADDKDSERGTVRLSKLVANHVTSTGGTGKSEWISRVLREAAEAYLDLWNGQDAAEEMETVYRKERAVQRLESELRALKDLDERAEQVDVDWFDELDKIAKQVQSMIQGEGATLLSPAERNTVFPTFRLVDETALEEKKSPNPIFRIRPTWPGERVPSVLTESSAANSANVNAMDIDPSVDGVSPTWLKGEWVLEFVSEEGQAGAGLVVRRDWLADAQRIGSGGTSTVEVGGDGDDPITQGGIRVENLLFTPTAQSVQNTPSQGAQPFPYTATFVPPTASTLRKGENVVASLEQHWSMTQAGPIGWIVGRVGVSPTQAGLVAAIEALRGQVVSNQLFTSVFTPQALRLDEENATEVVEDLEDWLSAPQSSFPVTLSLQEKSFKVIFPKPANATEDIGAVTANVELVISPKKDPPYVSVEVSGAEVGLMKGSTDLVEVVRRVEERLRG